MSWETDLFCNICFHKETYNSLWQVEDAINGTYQQINEITKVIHNLVIMTEPNKFFKDEDDIFHTLTEKVNELLGELEYCHIKIYKLELLKDNWKDCHDSEGRAIPLPKELGDNPIFLDGDFIETNKENDE